MALSAYCMYCLVQRQEENIRNIKDEELKSAYMSKVLRIISDSGHLTAPVVISKINQLHQDYFGIAYSFDQLKQDYNHLMLQEEPYLLQKIKSSEDPLLTALKYARTGNYIDFGAMGAIDDEKLKLLLQSTDEEAFDSTEYTNFLLDMKKAEHLVYLTDNCGEIVLDKLLILVLKELYPTLQINVIVRGKPVLNDATIEDARMVGLTEVVSVCGNGTEIAGTDLEEICEEAKQLIENADVILSKGQGNFETLHNCGLNIYYMFLCKCDWFVNRFGLERYKGVFLNDKNIITTMIGTK